MIGNIILAEEGINGTISGTNNNIKKIIKIIKNNINNNNKKKDDNNDDDINNNNKKKKNDDNNDDDINNNNNNNNNKKNDDDDNDDDNDDDINNNNNNNNKMNKMSSDDDIDIDIKYSQSQQQPFYRMRIQKKTEIVTMGVSDVNVLDNRGEYVDPEDWNSLIQQEDVVVVDTRNDYEINIGTFQNSINPNTKTFKEFPDYVKNHLVDKRQQVEGQDVDEQQQQQQDVDDQDDVKKNKKIAMFCTGGIRCEKATAFLKQQGYKNVYHLKGGILNYLKTVKEEDSLWNGECYVFDQRVSVKHNVQPGNIHVVVDDDVVVVGCLLLLFHFLS